MKHVLLLTGVGGILLGALPFPASSQEGNSTTGSEAKTAASETRSTAKEGRSASSSLMPSFDGSTDVASWNGRIWNVNNNRAFRSQFEKYLNTPAQNEKDDLEYQEIIGSILSKLSPAVVNSQKIDEAWALLFKASRYPIDNALSADLADAIYSVWLAQKEQDRLSKANTALKSELESMKWNMQAEVEETSLNNRPTSEGAAAKEWSGNRQLKREIRLRPYMNRIEEIENAVESNKTQTQASRLESKIQLQTMIVQLFLQRRFEHVLIGCRFYRSLFGDGDEKVTVADDAKQLFAQDSGLSPTIGVISALANETMGNVDEGVAAYLFLMDKEELHGATERLSEAFAIGQHLPAIKNLSREKKRLGLKYIQKSNELLTALEVKDYEQALKMVKELEEVSKDFKPTRPMAEIETARTVSRMHLAKARAAAAAGNREILESELRSATEIWPRNPELQAFSNEVFSQANEKHKALEDFESLKRRNDYRLIYEDSARFIAAAASDEKARGSLKEILDQMQLVEIAIARAKENAKMKNYPGAWEELEKIYREFPHDPKLNEIRTEYTARAASFVNSILEAQELEEQEQMGSALAWYLKARGYYLGSDIALEGINRISDSIFVEDQANEEVSDEGATPVSS
ncbi:MAG: hypothetical protein AAF558_07705 [Verrucomicrobiota bacterium]